MVYNIYLENVVSFGGCKPTKVTEAHHPVAGTISLQLFEGNLTSYQGLLILVVALFVWLGSCVCFQVWHMFQNMFSYIENDKPN